MTVSVELDEFSESELEEMSPPPPSPVPSPPPPPPTSQPMSIRDHIYQLQEQVELLEKIIMEPQIISITGVNNLRSETGRNWNDRLNLLFFEAKIPMFWILKILPDEDHPEDPNLVYVHLINDTVKDQVIVTLNAYLNEEYNRTVYIL
jgi:hypothetical protein